MLKHIKRIVFIVITILVIVSCGATAPSITESDILAAERNGTLVSLYAQVRDGEGLGKSLKPVDKNTYLTKIGVRLASVASQKINATLNDNRLPSGEVPLSVVLNQESQTDNMATWDKVQYDNILTLLANEKAKTNQGISQIEQKYQGLSVLDIGLKMAMLVELKALHGDAHRNTLQDREQQMLADAYDRIEQLIVSKDFTAAISQLKQLAEVAPDFRDVQSKLADLENIALQETFIAYVRDGETQKALALLTLIANGPYFADQKDNILPYALELANYYVALAVEATGEENLSDAYRLFKQARQVKSLFGHQTEAVTEEANFIDFIYNLYEQAYNKKSYGLALGYLHVIKEFKADFPELETYQRLTFDYVMNAAVKRVSTTAFNGEEHARSIGRSISSKITQYVFDTLPNDVRVVEREHLKAVLREQEIDALQSGSGVQIDSADLLIQGTVLEANVETNESKGRKVQRVVTERMQVTNPAYQQWLAMSSSERNKTPEPAKMISQEKKEDIGINVTYVRKVAVLSISYRVVDATSARVLFADSVLDKKEVSDESAEGMQLGDFVSEYKMVNLPSDIELLSDLAVLLSRKIGEKVVELLKDPEVEYRQASRKLFDERNYVKATEELAKAVVMSASKKKETAEMVQDLKNYAVTARLDD